jgi:hypothetical protein
LCSASVLALSWLHHSADRLIAGCSVGVAAMYRVDNNQLRRDEVEEEELMRTPPPSALQLHHSYAQPLTEQMTSLHCNSDDTLLCASGYTHSVNVLDLQTGQQLRRMKNIHQGHINIARFANL